MRIIGEDQECRLIEFNVKSTAAGFRNVTLNHNENLYVPFSPDVVFVFNDTREIDNLIHMLEEVKRENDGFLGRFERVIL